MYAYKEHNEINRPLGRKGDDLGEIARKVSALGQMYEIRQT